ncbi:unnamed protein product [Protopolystoma xenopodis]|uniref:Uncharacterized protein n=1 Tax=Protopolystoma xenopodis TaxID=117903 RepID=A0A3S5AB35_9PLAT|nr:unnamed protein product [Protopolystoma xenopodis]
MLPRSDAVRHMTDESLTPFHRNRKRMPRKQRQHESSNKANRQLVKRNPPSSSGGTDLRISLNLIDSWSRGIRRRLLVEPTFESLHPTAGQEEFAVVFWWNRPSNLFTQHLHSKCK